jgi:hypothetical protein
VTQTKLVVAVVIGFLTTASGWAITTVVKTGSEAKAIAVEVSKDLEVAQAQEALKDKRLDEKMDDFEKKLDENNRLVRLLIRDRGIKGY